MSGFDGALIENNVIDLQIAELYRDPELARRYSQAGRAFAQTLSWDGLVPNGLEVIRSTVNGSP